MWKHFLKYLFYYVFGCVEPLASGIFIAKSQARLRDWACTQHISKGPFGKFTIKKLNDSLRLSCLKLTVWTSPLQITWLKTAEQKDLWLNDPSIEVFSRQPKLMDTLFIKLSKPCLRYFLSCFIFHIWQ